MSASKKQTCASKTGDYFEEYCHASTIHGLRYIGEKRSIYERAFWALIFLTSVGGCVFMSLLIYSKYDQSPVIVSFATRETPIYAIPFPAVTICPETKALHKYSYSILHDKIDAGTATHDEIHYFEALSMLCETSHKFLEYSEVDHVIEDIPEIFHKIRPDFLRQAFACSFLGEYYRCSELFSPIMTDEGVCYSFNIMSHSDIFRDTVQKFRDYHNGGGNKSSSWSIEDGYEDTHQEDTYPRRALISGVANGLTINLITMKDSMDTRCRSGQGYKATLHNPMQLPQLKREYIRIPVGESVLTAVKPAMITTSKQVKKHLLKKRDCLFPDERKLTFFKYYSQSNCQVECLTNFMIEHLKKNFQERGTSRGYVYSRGWFERNCCVDIYMPRKKGMVICGYKKLKCMVTAEAALHIRELTIQFKGGDSSMKSCDCMPICTDLTYGMETSETKWDWEAYLPSNMTTFKERVHLSRFTVYLRVNDFLTSERNELYGWFDFLANFGGLVGLFTGFSILSAVELIYFFSLRIFCNVQHYGNWVGRQNRELV